MKTIQVDGMIWPANVAKYEKKPGDFHTLYAAHAPDMELMTKHVKKFDVVVQAGGHCGSWPRWLATRFATVYTFEPDLENFICLMQNANMPNVFAMRAMLGEHHGPATLIRTDKNTGGHHGSPKVGTVPVFRIDDLALPHCDAIVLDVEGMELPALRGAQETIAKYKPVVMLENRDHGTRYGWGYKYEDIKAFLSGYKQVEQVAHDVVLCAT